jgi:spectinomycin phosphotransferase
MLARPDISDNTIIASLRDSYGLRISQVAFLPLGYANSAVFHVLTDSGKPYFLKLRKGSFNEIAVDVPAFLHSRGIRQVMAPIATTSRALWMHVQDFDWILYPFFDGRTGFEIALSKTQWIVFGQCMKAIHTTRLPAGLIERVPQEDFSSSRRNHVKTFLNRLKQDPYGDPVSMSFAALLLLKRAEIYCIVERAEQLAQLVRDRITKLVMCHSDLHGRNILVSADDEMVIVDWDAPTLAPTERDLMFVGGGVGGIWNNDQETKWFYQGYGQTEIDLVALTYYRYERIVTDIAERSEQIFGRQGSIKDRKKGLRLIEQFLPNNVVDIAHRSYRQLSERNFE